MSRFLLPHLQQLEPYVPGEQPQDRKYIKLNTNESPYPPSPKVVRELDEKRVSGLNLYPDPLAKTLREAIGEAYGLGAECVFVGNGSDEVLGFAFAAYGDERHPVTIPEVSYGFYQVFSRLFRVSPRIVPLHEDFSIDVDGFCDTRTMVVLANPNAPTGMALPLESIKRIIASNAEHIVLIDEAYIDFGGESAVSLLAQHENLLIVRTFSKSRSLAGGRLGYALANASVIRDLEKIKGSFHPYSVSSLTMAAGIEAMKDQEYFQRCVKSICEEREKTADALRRLGFIMTDSQTNFLFVRHPKLSGEGYYQQLKRRGILVRYLSGKRLENYVRITIGTAEQMDCLLQATKEILEGADV